MKYAKSNDIDSKTIENKNELLLFFLDVAINQRVLIISASNNYIFPKELIEMGNVDIINFHDALLPQYPGRNAPSWVIYYGENETGITWHYVSSSVDAGDIVVQKVYEMPDDIKAYQLSAKLMEIAADAFKTIYDDIIVGMAERRKQPSTNGKRKIYKSWEIPSDGVINLNDKPDNIYRILRSMDYGKNNVFPLPVADYKNGKIQIKRYKITSKKEISENKLYLPYEEQYLCLNYNSVFD